MPRPPLTRSSLTYAGACWCLALLLAGCDRTSSTTAGGSAQPSANGPPGQTNAAGSVTGAAAPEPAASAAQVAANPYAGAWGGAYRAAKASVTVPDGVDYKSWSADSGAEMVGPGQLKLTVAADGRVSGSADGALGKQLVSGQIDGEMLRAKVTAETPESGMSGVLTGPVSGKTINAKLRVSDGQGNLVREASVKLSRSAKD